MAEERMVYNSWIADSNTKTELSGLSGSNEKLIEYVFTKAFNLGRQKGYSKGYDEAMSSIGAFDSSDFIDDDIPDSADEITETGTALGFDASSEIFGM